MTLSIGRTGGRASIARRVSLPVIILIVLLSAGIMPPFVFLLYSSLHLLDSEGAFGALTFAHFAAIFSSRAFGPTLLNSLVYSFGSALLALVIGAAHAWLPPRPRAPPAPPRLRG